jgi:hypothetical protein
MASVSEDDLKDLVRSAKPAFAAKGTTADADRGLTFQAIHNGRGDWVIQRPARTELLAGSRTLLAETHGVKVIDIPVAVNNDVKSMLDGRRIAYLSEGTLELIGTTSVAGRECFDVRAWGLRQGDDRRFDMAVDKETGAILRMAQGGKVLVEVTEFQVGVITST